MAWYLWPGPVAVLVATSGLTAQVHYRSLDGERPTRVRDAYPIERYAFEAGLSVRFTPSPSDAQGLSLDPEIEYGIARGTGIGIGVAASADFGGGPARTSSRLGAFIERNLLRETLGFPAIAVRLDGSASLRDGPLGAGALASSVALTRSFGRDRLHLNGGWTFAAPATVGPAEALDRWFIGAAMDRTAIRPSLLFVGEAVVARGIGASSAEATVAVGVRRQITPTVVGSFGTGLTFGGGPARLGLTMSWSTVFAWPGLMPGRAR
ncbi:MAG: hypothetical protein ABI647_08045 [Gemmatimonadota bacterium]